MAKNQVRQDFEKIFEYLVIAARTDPGLRLALERQSRRLLVTLGALPESFLATTLDTADGRPEGAGESPSGSRLDALVTRFQGESNGRGGYDSGPMAGESFEQTGDEVARLIDACHLKARATRWRVHALADGLATVDQRGELINEGGDSGIYLWMVTRNKEGELSRDPHNFERLESTYGICARTLEAWQELPLSRAGEILPLIAEAQGMIRVAAAEVGLQRPEDTAQAVYEWLRGQAADRRIYIHRHMRPNDPANPDLVHLLEERLTRLMNPPPFRVIPGEDGTGDERGPSRDFGDDDEEDSDKATPGTFHD